jgi:hypothetical protein
MNVTTTWACLIRNQRIKVFPCRRFSNRSLRLAFIYGTLAFAQKKSVSRGSGAEGDTTSMVRPQRNHHPSQATRRPFSRLFDNGQERNLAHNHACDTGPDEAFGRRCVLQPRILVRSDVLTQKVQHLLDLRR